MLSFFRGQVEPGCAASNRGNNLLSFFRGQVESESVANDPGYNLFTFFVVRLSLEVWQTTPDRVAIRDGVFWLSIRRQGS